MNLLKVLLNLLAAVLGGSPKEEARADWGPAADDFDHPDWQWTWGSKQ
jgi:hypothetical protein